MNLKELFPLFSPIHALPDRVLFINTAEFERLKRYEINHSRVFILVSKGCLSLQIGGKTHYMEAHSFLDMLDGAPIQITSFSTDLKVYCLLPEYKFARESLKNLKPGPESHLLDTLHAPIIHLSIEEKNIIEKQLQLFEENLHNMKHHFREELAKTYFRSFMLELGNILFNHKENIHENSLTISRQEFIAMEFMKLVWLHFQTEHNVNFYADKLCISVKHLSRIVKETFNRTPHTIICEEILHTAMKLLEDNDSLVQQVAENLHFSDQASFCKFFKKHMQLSPMEYKRQAR